MDNKRLGKALDIMRLAEEAAARPGGISLVQIVDTFGVTLRTAQRMSRALEEAFPMVQTRTDKERRKWWQLPDSRLLHLQGIRDSELSALEMGIRRAEREGAATEVAALTSLRNRLLGTMPPTFARRAEVDAEAVLEARGHACRPGPRAQYSALVLGAIDNALKGPFMLQIDYAGAQDAAPRSRAVEPYGVLFGMRGYLIAREIDNGGKYRHFRLDRISRASLLQDSFVRDPGFDLGKHAAQAFGSFHSETEYGPVEWRFTPRSRRCRADLHLSPRPAGSRRGRWQSVRQVQRRGLAGDGVAPLSMGCCGRGDRAARTAHSRRGPPSQRFSRPALTGEPASSCSRRQTLGCKIQVSITYEGRL